MFYTIGNNLIYHFNWRVITPHMWCGGQTPLVRSVNTTRAEGKHLYKL